YTCGGRHIQCQAVNTCQVCVKCIVLVCMYVCLSLCINACVCVCVCVCLCIRSIGLCACKHRFMMHACEGDRRKQPLIFHISLANAFTLAARAGLPRERISP